MSSDSSRSPSSSVRDSADLPNIPPVICHYKLLRRIGQGAFGEVWLARNLLLECFRAVKVIHRGAFVDSGDYYRELTGVRNFEPLSREHAGLVDLLEIGVNEAQGYFYYAMELADDAGQGSGQSGSNSSLLPNQPSHFKPQPLEWETYSPLTLSARIRAEGPIPLAECLRVAVALTDALEFLHQHGLIHRDIKPSNIIFVGNSPKLADVGTVTRVDEAKTMVGTEGFQAPEGPGKPQADLYSLGKVFYEISTGKDRQRFPEPLTRLADFVDRAQWQEFNAVVNKACQPDPTRRYPSTTELRADLLTIQAGRSVRRQWLLQKRFRQTVWVATAIVTAAAVGLFVQNLRLQKAAAERGRILAEANAASVKAQEAERGRALLELEKVIRPPHEAGWSAQAWQMAGNAAARFGFDADLQSQAAASLAGDDATALFQTNGIGGSSAVFSPDGKRVLYGSLPDATLTGDPGKTHLLDFDAKKLTAFPAPGAGPVAFLPDGTPVQFSADTDNHLALWLVGRRVPPPPSESDRPAALGFFALPNSETITNISVLAMTPDGSFVAAGGTTTSNRTICAVWNGTNANLLVAAPVVNLGASKPLSGVDAAGRGGEPAQHSVTALALTPDGSLIATSGNDSQVTLWHTGRGFQSRASALLSSALGGTESRTVDAFAENDGDVSLARFSPDRLPIHSLAFGRDLLSDPLSPAKGPAWLLAVGDSGGGVTIWRIAGATQQLVTRCLGAEWQRTALAFSPDSTLLASGGRGTLIWDTATGSPILNLHSDFERGLAFSPDGAIFATTVQRSYRNAASSVLKFQNGRGIRTLRGLARPVTKVRFCQNAGWLAALSNDWQIGIWDLTRDQLIHVLSMPPGLFTADNAGLVFNRNGTQLAYMAGGNAVLLDVQSGSLIRKWRVPPGYVEDLAFDSAGRLLAFHLESADERAAELQRPYTARIRLLSDDGTTTSLIQLPELDLDGAMWTPDGAYLVCVGSCVQDNRTNRQVICIESATPRVVWRIPFGSNDLPNNLAWDAAGKFLAFSAKLNDGNAGAVCEFAASNLVFTLPRAPEVFHSTMHLSSWRMDDGLELHSFPDAAPLLTLPGNGNAASYSPVFSADGRLLAHGNFEGTVSVYDLNEINHKLGDLKLSWSGQAAAQR